MVALVSASERHVVMPRIVGSDEEVFKKAYDAVHHKDIDYEPAETRLHLLHLQNVLATHKSEFGSNEQLEINKYKDETNELIDLARIVSNKCDIATFERMQNLLVKFGPEASLASYIIYHKKRLGEFCDKILDERLDM